ncbi:hypothetical protein GPUN_0667 [Glaciecola punicea ACAM 611]|uniref:diguanylate cyclase n=1 Tax=Glaciecola punicea ACAM 611 TaxID=1121923 RepID=H5T930_9ALTE|nr:hypothetical protein GPUN_0667 [Glaciecola punicea ACAM 611]
MADYLTNSGLRKNDTVARWGGEEIVILLPNTSLDDAYIMARRLCEGLSQNKMHITRFI